MIRLVPVVTLFLALTVNAQTPAVIHEYEQKQCMSACAHADAECLKRCDHESVSSRPAWYMTSPRVNYGFKGAFVKEMDHCKQLPIACSKDEDCTCSNCCGQLGEGGPTLCQPSC